MTTVTVEGAGETAEVPASQSEVLEVEAAEAEAVAAVADSAVEIARINAERDIVIAEISAETTLAQTEAINEGLEESQWQSKLTSLEAQYTALQLEIAEMRLAHSTPPNSSEALDPPPNLLELEKSDPTSDNPEAAALVVEAVPAPEVPTKKVRKAPRWI